MNDITHFVKAIQQFFPDLAIHSAVLSGGGQNNSTIIINQNLIFRFPKHIQAVRQLKTEVEVLKTIHGRVSLPVPTPTYTHLSPGAPEEAFVGYPLLSGAPFWKETFSALHDNEAIRVIARQLGLFLSELHAIPVQDLSPLIPIVDTLEEWTDIYNQIRSRLFPYMNPTAKEKVREHFKTYFENWAVSEPNRVLKHGDFGPSNILIDAVQRRISGIIDFGGSAIGDPAYDFAGLLGGYGETLVEAISRTYPGLDSLWGRIRFYQGTFALLEALFGLEFADKSAFENGIRDFV